MLRIFFCAWKQDIQMYLFLTNNRSELQKQILQKKHNKQMCHSAQAVLSDLCPAQAEAVLDTVAIRWW